MESMVSGIVRDPIGVFDSHESYHTHSYGWLGCAAMVWHGMVWLETCLVIGCIGYGWGGWESLCGQIGQDWFGLDGERHIITMNAHCRRMAWYGMTWYGISERSD